MSSDELTKLLAVVGGVTGPLGLLVSYLSYRRDRAAVRVKLRTGRKVSQGRRADEEVRQTLAYYQKHGESPPMELYIRDPDKTWASIEVTNVGRRKIIIDKIGWVPTKGGNFIIPGGFLGHTQWLPAELDEANARDFPIDEESLGGVLAVFASDSVGRGHYGSFQRSWPGAVLRLKTLLRIKPYV